MPRARARCLFELGGQWIAELPGRRGLYRFWNDARTGRTSRASLGTADLETAKRALAEIIVKGAPKTADAFLSIVLEDYFTGRTDHLPSRKPARHAGSLFLECWGATVRVRELTDARQKEFVMWSIARGHALAYIARNMGVLAAAIARANIAMKIVHHQGEILEKWALKPKQARKAFIPTDAELARVLAADMPDNLRRWMLNAMATGGRPEAVLQLSPKSRRRDAPLIDLNPDGRRQNKKYRPTVRLLPVQRKWFDKWEKEEPVKSGGCYCGYASVDSIDTALQRLRTGKHVNLPKLSVYSFRHKVTTVLRAAKVPAEQISYQLGHRRTDLRSTGNYGEYDPGYLAEAAAALNAWILKVQKLAANSHGIRTTTAERRKNVA